MFGRLRIGIMAGLFASAAGAAWAQGPVYQCSSHGQTWLSRTPCPAGPASGGTTLKQYGAVPERPVYPTYRRSGDPRPADAHTQYLSADCARISEGIRTGPARGVPYSVIGELRQEYQRKCQEDEREARSQAYQDEKRAREERKALRDADRSAKAEVVRQSAQCDEMLRALANKRRRLDTLTPGEREDLDRFQARHDERCKR